MGNGEGDPQSQQGKPSGLGEKLKGNAAELSASIVSVAGQAATAVGDLNGDGRLDAEDAKIARDRAAKTLSIASSEGGKLVKAVAAAPLTKDVATYAAVGAVIALPLPIVGSAVGAAVGAGLGLWRNMTRQEAMTLHSSSSAAQKDPIVELERLHGLKEKGIITEEEFLVQKAKILG